MSPARGPAHVALRLLTPGPPSAPGAGGRAGGDSGHPSFFLAFVVDKMHMEPTVPTRQHQ